MSGIKKLYGEPPRYYIFREDGEPPKRWHKARFRAEKEAARLALKHPGAVFHVMKLKTTITVPAAPPPEPVQMFWEGDVVRLRVADDATVTTYEVTTARPDSYCLICSANGAIVKGILRNDQLVLVSAGPNRPTT